MISNIIRQGGKDIPIDYLVVAGGGSGASGSRSNAAGGGGGAGGVLQGSTSVKTGLSYALTVGTGGATSAPLSLGNNGANSVFNSLVAIGGGAGAGHTVASQFPNNIAGSAGGSGGGGSGSSSLGGTPGAGGAGTSGQGYAGGSACNNQPLGGGGGGGAGGVGGNGATGTGSRTGSGGTGIVSSITGVATYYGGGGGGGVYCYNGVPYIGGLAGFGGNGGGGAGGPNISTAGGNGTPNTGGGGGGGATCDPSTNPTGTNGGAGGSGVVIIKCPIAYEIIGTYGLNYSYTISGAYQVYTFYSGTGNIWFKQSGTTDPYFNSTSLLLHMDGANTSTNFVDSGPNALTVTAANATISTTQGKYGGSSGSFTGTASNLVVSSSTLFDFGSGDFTIECWIYWLGGGGSPGTIFTTAFPTDNQGVFIGLLSTGAFNYLAGNGTWAFNSTTTSNSLSANQWYHIAYVRSGSTFTVYVNGVASGSSTSSSALSNSNNQALIGGRNVFGQYFRGYIDDFRVTKYARYTSAFTPPTQALPNIYMPFTSLPVSNAALWIDASQQTSVYSDAGVTPVTTSGQSVYQWNDLSGNSRNATQATSANRPTWVPPASARVGLGAMSFSGSQWIDLASNTAIAFGTGDFTIEGWIKPVGYSGNSVLLGCGNNGFVMYFTSAGLLKAAYYGTGTTVTSASALTAGTWYHVAFCRSGTTSRLFVNGVLSASATSSDNFAGDQPARLGGDPTPANGNAKYNGQMQNMIVYKGQALYTANFTPWMS